MIVMVDESPVKDRINSYGYTNMIGTREGVYLNGSDFVSLLYLDTDANLNTICVDDIPKLIKALQAAYNHKKGIK